MGAPGSTAKTCAPLSPFKCFEFIPNGLYDFFDSIDQARF